MIGKNLALYKHIHIQHIHMYTLLRRVNGTTNALDTKTKIPVITGKVLKKSCQTEKTQ